MRQDPGRWARLAAVLFTGAALAGCGGNPSVPAPTSAVPSPPTFAPPSPTVPAPITADWRAPGKASLPDGWGLADCEGDAPLICVTSGGQTVGQLEILAYPLDSLPTFTATLARSGVAAALDEHARSYIKDFTADRATGCGASYRVAPDGPAALTIKGTAAVRYGFVGTLGQRPSEKIIQYALMRGRDLVILSATAADPGGCLPPEGPHLTSDQLTRFAPVLDRVVAGSDLPPTPGG